MYLPNYTFKPTPEIESSFDYFLKENFIEGINKPTFRDEKEKLNAMVCWFIADQAAKAERKKINDFYLAFYRLTGISV